VKTQTSLPGFDSPHDAVQENGTYGGKGKAVGCVLPTALLFEQGGQYRISKSKYAVSIMAVTLATESTNASLASL
jgi:hypothetical protein